MKGITIAISIYNIKKYIHRCIKSVQSQTFREIEILCIDDGSTDGSREILKEIASLDSRIVVILHTRNKGLLSVRKTAIENANREYILFLDGDDTLELYACEKLYSVVESKEVDILQFGRNTINAGNVSQYEIDSMEKFAKPYVEDLYDKEILWKCFYEEKYNYNLACKLIKLEICKEAFSYIDDGYYYMGEDILGYFVVSYFAHSYCAIEDKLYNYYFGIGASKPGNLDLEGFRLRCSVAKSVIAVETFIRYVGAWEQYLNVYKKIERRFLSDNFEAWYYRLSQEFREIGKVFFIENWGEDKFILSLLYDIENKQYDINQKAHKIYIEQEEIDTKNNIIKEQQAEIDILKNYILELEVSYQHILKSTSYRLGKVVTWVPRVVVSLFKN